MTWKLFCACCSLLIAGIGQSAFALDYISSKRTLSLTADPENQKINVRLCNNSDSANCYEDEVSAEILIARLEEAKNKMNSFLSDQEEIQSLKNRMKKQITQGEAAVIELPGGGEAYADTIDMVDNVFDVYLPAAVNLMDAAINQAPELFSMAISQFEELSNEKINVPDSAIDEAFESYQKQLGFKK